MMTQFECLTCPRSVWSHVSSLAPRGYLTTPGIEQTWSGETVGTSKETIAQIDIDKSCNESHHWLRW